MDRTDDFMAAIVRMRGDVEQLKRLGVSRWGAANPNTAWGRVALATKTAAQNGFTSTIADISSLTVTFTAVANRIYRTTLHLPVVGQNTSAATVVAYITDGSNTVLRQSNTTMGISAGIPITLILPETIGSSGSVTRKARLSTTAGTFDINGSSTFFGHLEVEDCGPA
jgi:hypothetical protein